MGACNNNRGLEFNFLGAAAKYLNLKAPRCLNEEVDPALKGLNQRDLKIWTGQGNDNAGKSCPAPHIKYLDAFRDQGSDS